jgi:hypothetical protein
VVVVVFIMEGADYGKLSPYVVGSITTSGNPHEHASGVKSIMTQKASYILSAYLSPVPISGMLNFLRPKEQKML